MENLGFRGWIESEKVGEIQVFIFFRGLLVKIRTDQFYSNPRMILRGIKYSWCVERTFEKLKKSAETKFANHFPRYSRSGHFLTFLSNFIIMCPSFKICTKDFLTIYF